MQSLEQAECAALLITCRISFLIDCSLFWFRWVPPPPAANRADGGKFLKRDFCQINNRSLSKKRGSAEPGPALDGPSSALPEQPHPTGNVCTVACSGFLPFFCKSRAGETLRKKKDEQIILLLHKTHTRSSKSVTQLVRAQL